ncbi:MULTISPECIES: hypothetical protein [Corynebacterium]|uniref:hypothetical protein n=1 Tax=Corynebacterium TaxID=1716 RepID=UPI00124D5205|nr:MULTISPECIES: hypothetical protein [Corynebacterium]
MDPLSPVQIETHIRELVNRIAKGIGVFSRAYGDFMEKDREFDRVRAAAYLAAEGSVEDRKQRAVLDTEKERAERDVAEQAYRHADRLLKALELELRAYQSIGASVRAAYGVAGRGET